MSIHPLQPYWTEKAKAAIKAERLKGRHLGKAPLGYRNVTINGKPAIEIDPETAPLVREAFRLVALKRMSLRKVLAELDRQGLRTKAGKSLGVSSLHKMLGNPFYVGIIKSHKGTVEGKHPRLIPYYLFKEAKLQTSGDKQIVSVV